MEFYYPQFVIIPLVIFIFSPQYTYEPCPSHLVKGLSISVPRELTHFFSAIFIAQYCFVCEQHSPKNSNLDNTTLGESITVFGHNHYASPMKYCSYTCVCNKPAMFFNSSNLSERKKIAQPSFVVPKLKYSLITFLS